MKTAILSGKGGAGKTFVAVNLAAAAQNASYIDCDVEEPNGRLFLKPCDIEEQRVFTPVPAFDPALCTGCRACVKFCRFNALLYIREKPMIFPEICHGCGGCELVCPVHAISESSRQVGVLEIGRHEQVQVVTGILNQGEASGVPVIEAALKAGIREDALTVIDCPPGSACSVMESVKQADFCLLVAEPTAFGFHNFKMVQELVSLLHKPHAVIINKADGDYPPLKEFLQERSVPLWAEIPYNPDVAGQCAEGNLVYEACPAIRPVFDGILTRLGGVNP